MQRRDRVVPFVIDLTNDGHLVWPPRPINGAGKLARTSVDLWQLILMTLATEGPVEDRFGLAGSELANRVGWEHGQGAFTAHVASMEQAGLIQREVRGRRTFRVSLAID